MLLSPRRSTLHHRHSVLHAGDPEDDSFDLMTTRQAITQLIFVRDPSRPVDCAIVLGCPSLTNMDPAIALYRQGFTRCLLITGHGPTSDSEPEWARYRAYALAAGIPDDAMLVEREARNTRENFAFSEALLAREIGWPRIHSLAVISKAIHSRRALMTARVAFPSHVTLTMQSPADDDSIQPETWWQSADGRARVLDEVRKIGEYSLAGHLGGL